eukprot:Sspe_Gene.2027::Locus_674_Transcript_1_1_Confidence_1.000_Length_6307::g.2027::m.2027/K06894/K06894; uncharacterized protein
MSTSTSFVVHAGTVYVGTKCDTAACSAGKPLTVGLAAVDVDGAGEVARVEVKVFRKDLVVEGLEEVEKDVEVLCTEVTTGEDGKGEVSFTPARGGRHEVVVRVADGHGRINESRRAMFVLGGATGDRMKVTNVVCEEARLIPSKEEYAVGDEAEVTVCSPFEGGGARGTAMWISEGLIHKEHFDIANGLGTHTLRMRIEDRMVPNVTCKVHLVGSTVLGEKTTTTRPAVAGGTVSVRVSSKGKQLNVSVSPAHTTLRPGGETDIEVCTGEQAEVTLFVVDEAVLALAGYTLPSPIEIFYPPTHGRCQVIDSRYQVYLKSWEAVHLEAQEEERAMLECAMMSRGAPLMQMCGMAMERGEPEDLGFRSKRSRRMDVSDEPEAAQPIEMRSNFSSLALFESSLMADKDGKVRCRVKLPDNLTRYRVYAFAHTRSTHHFGVGESHITATNPFMVRPSVPRFLNFGDRAGFTVVLQNQTDEDGMAEVCCRAKNLRATGAQGYRVLLKGGGRAEVRFGVEVEQAGEAVFQVGGVMGDYGDAAEVRLPVWTPATTEAFATCGEVDADGGCVAQRLEVPGVDRVWGEFGGLGVSTSSTMLQSLTGGLEYLLKYPFECTEQVASRLLALGALEKVAKAFQVEGAEKVVEMAQELVPLLMKRQRADGGFGFWERSEETSPFITLHVLQCLAVLREGGHNVVQEGYGRLLEVVKSIERVIPEQYGERVRAELKAKAAYVLAKIGEVKRAEELAKESMKAMDVIGHEAMAWAAFALLRGDAKSPLGRELMQKLRDRVTETGETAHFVTKYDEDGLDKFVLLRSDHRTDAAVLECVLEEDPRSPLATKLAKGLLAHKKKGDRWTNTSENCAVLVAMKRYFELQEGTVPRFTARTWLGGRGCLSESTFEGRETKTLTTTVPMSFLQQGPSKTEDLVVAKTGEGRLYYRLTLSYAPKDLKLRASDQGFTVRREYIPLGEPSDVAETADGYDVKIGALIKVELTMAATSRRYHVALVDKLPAGLEVVNPALKGQEHIAPSPPVEVAPCFKRCMFQPHWYEHANLRDERVEAFASLLWAGVYKYSYVARATSAGEFEVPPAKAEEMYSPEIFGRSSTMRVRVVS